MSETIYTWILRLYPSSFRNAYGEEALQLLRDRARDETGFFSRLRLWLDLIADLLISLLREFQSARATVAVTHAEKQSRGIPCFGILEGESLSFGALVHGGIAALLVCGSTMFLFSHPGHRLPSAPDFNRSQIQSLPFLRQTPSVPPTTGDSSYQPASSTGDGE
jgi:hypothetical protein